MKLDLPTALLSLIGMFIFLFVYWRRLKEDYTTTQLFSSGFYIIFGIILGSYLIGTYLSPKLYPMPYFDPKGMWFWGSLLGFVSFYSISAKRFGLKFHETFEAALVGGLYLLCFFFGGFAVFNLSRDALVFSIISALFIMLFYYIDSRYRRFTWYKSGRVGFAGFSVISLLFLLRSIAAIIVPSAISVAGKIDSLISASISFLLFLIVYNLARKNG